MRKLMKYWHIWNFQSPRQRTLPQPVNKALAWPGIALNIGWQEKSGEMWNPCPTRTQSVAALCSPTESVCPSQAGQERANGIAEMKTWPLAANAVQGPRAVIGNPIKTSLPKHSELGSKCNWTNVRWFYLVAEVLISDTTAVSGMIFNWSCPMVTFSTVSVMYVDEQH